MIVMGIDTSAYANAIGVVDGDRVLADAVFPARADSLEKIVANIDGTLKGIGLALNDIEGIGVGLGPGSWTGIRVGVTVGKMLAYSTGKPLAGIPTLDVLAYPARDAAEQVCAVIDAGTKGTVYAARYKSANNSMVRIGDYYVGAIEGLAELITMPTVLVSAEAQYYAQLLGNFTRVTIKAREEVPHGAAVALLAAGRLGRGESDNTLALTPLYLKESAARAFAGKYMRSSKSEGGT